MTSEEYIDNAATNLNPTSEQHLLRVSSVIKELNLYIENQLELSSSGINDRLNYLIGYFTLTLDIPHLKGLKILRARKFEKTIDDKPCFDLVEELSYPPPEFTSLGRCNKKEKPIFYGCLYAKTMEHNGNVAFSEVRALKYERVNVLDAISKEDINLRFIGIWNYIDRDAKPHFLSQNVWQSYKETYEYMREKFNDELFVAYQLCDAFFADILRKKGSARLYDVTSSLSEMYLESGKGEGILYTSVEAEGYPVVALSTKTVKEKLTFEKAISYEITEDYGYSKYKTVPLHEGEVMGNNIVWKDI